MCPGCNKPLHGSEKDSDGCGTWMGDPPYRACEWCAAAPFDVK